MSALRWIAWRFQLRGTERGTFSAMTLFAWLAIGVGVAAMGSLLAVMYGFESSLRDKVLRAYPHLMVRPPSGQLTIPSPLTWTQRLRGLSAAREVVPFVESEMIVQSERRTLGGVVWGIPLSDFERYRSGIQEGALPDPKSAIPQILVGSELAQRLGARVGGTLKIISPTERSGAMGMVPQAQTFEVSGLYASGHYEFDQQYLFLILEDAQDLMKYREAISGWHVWGESLDSAERLQSEVQSQVPENWRVQSWEVFNSALFHSLRLEQYAMFTILSFAIAIAVMNIVITLMMFVSHKKRNIGILRAMGASSRQIHRIFLWQGAMLGGVGMVLGAVLTVLFIVYVRYFSQFQLPEIYYDRTIPVEIRPLSLLAIYSVASLMIFLATWFPARKAAGIDPIEAIKET